MGGELFFVRTSNNQIIREVQLGWKYGFVADRFRQLYLLCGVHLLAIYQVPVDLHDWQKSQSEDRQVDIIFGACRPTPINRMFKQSRIFCIKQIRLPKKANILGGEIFFLRAGNYQITRELQMGWK